MIDTQPTSVRRTVIRDMPSGRRVIAFLEMDRARDGERFCPNGLSPSFSLTGEVYDARSNARGKARQKAGREPDSSGAISDEIVRAMPSLKQFAAMHLSNPETGEPMHAEANGWYWYAGSRDDLRDVVTRSGGYTGFGGIYAHQLEARGLPDTDDGRRRYCYQIACKLLRVDEITLKLEADTDDPAEIRKAFSAFVNDQRDRWKQEAAEAREFITSLPEDDAA